MIRNIRKVANLIAITGSGEIANSVADLLIAQANNFVMYGRNCITTSSKTKHYIKVDNYAEIEFDNSINNLLITNGSFMLCNFTNYKSIEIDELITANFLVVAKIIWKFLNDTKKNKNKNIFVLGSTAAYDLGVNTSLYSSSKLAIKGLLQVLNKEFADENIKFTYISFSTVKNTMGLKVPGQDVSSLIDIKSLAAEILGRVLRTDNYYEPEVIIRRKLIQSHEFK
jgi:NADP-dependent 3-hydroxy acid dehydrogenase YdfG